MFSLTLPLYLSFSTIRDWFWKLYTFLIDDEGGVAITVDFAFQWLI